MPRRFITAFVACIWLSPLAAQDVIDCPWRGLLPADAMSFAEGEVHVGTAWGETGRFVMVLSPPRDADGQRQCRVVAFSDGTAGFLSVDLSRVEASHDPATGLKVTLPVAVDFTGEPLLDQAMLDIVVDQVTGEVRAELWGG